MQVILVQNINLNSNKFMKNLKVTMTSLKYIEKLRRTRKKVKIKFCISSLAVKKLTDERLIATCFESGVQWHPCFFTEYLNSSFVFSS